MVDQINQGIVEKVENPSHGQPGKIYFVPIRRDKTTTKLRIVYDASSKQQPDLPSLNDCLLAGPPLTEKILDILLRSRVHRIVLAGDIEKAFLMVSVAPKDRDVLRFLWFDNPEDENPNFSVYRFTRVMFGVSSSPFLLNATARYHIERFIETDPEFVKNVLRSIYVDDLSTGSSDVETAYQLYEDAKERFATGGFNLRKFVSNSSELRERIHVNESKLHPGNGNITSSPIHEEDETYTKFMLGNSTSNEDQKILGIKWNFVQDNFVIDWSEVLQLAQNIVPTKRLVVSISSKLYDPMGFLSPFIVQFKLFFQDLCKRGVRWDDALEEEHLSKWRRLIELARNMKPILVSRCYFQNIQESIISCHLHGYCDSSSKAYAAVVYLKIVTTTSIYVRFLSSKTRIAPINSQTIPRLELLSALILARLVNTTQKALECELQIDGIHCWTDSKVAYYWIRQEEREWKQFIQNRVEEIRKLVSARSFNHCPGLQNPADIPSRGMNPFEFVNNSLWIKGPEWLINFEESMPNSTEDLDLPEECLIEMKVKDRDHIKGQVASVMVAVENYSIANVISCQDYSNLHRLLRVTANVLKFVDILKSRVNKVPVNSQYVSEAQVLWIKEVQSQLVNHSNFETWKRQLDVYEDDKGVLRCRGRLGNSQLTNSCKFPTLLDPSHYFTNLVVISCHRKVLHNGVKETLTELRSSYWIIRGRQYIRKLIHQCVTCRKYEGKPYQSPSTPPLPDFRVQESAPFAYVGVDFAGPLFVKINGTAEQHKVWLCLFTCCSTRAVHLDVVPDLFTSSFLRCFQRFTARRGYPVRVISDNGKTFKSAAKLLQDKLVWSFNVEKAPWWGGIFERMIQSVKRCLKKTIGGAKLSYDELVTVVIEIEAVLNSRPISFVSTEDVEEPLTPSHLIHGRRILNVPEGLNVNTETPHINQEDMRRRVRYLNQTLDHFWRRWSSEYLLELRNRYAIKVKSGPKMSIGDVVTVHNENLPRCRWRIGRIIELIPGEDKSIRAVRLRVRAVNGQINIIQRPVQKLYPLETSHTETNPVITTSNDDNSDPVIEVPRKQSNTDDPDPVVEISDSSPQRSDPNTPVSNSRSQRQRRVAAQESDRRRKQWIKDLMS
ncbi:hypothetical protein SNE40_013739 [Patella caerulea]|uniref:Integrase catalytic domain-containing protein n=1 Tax=Patella caerulea TaxID=87958 RepID=A0AAN8JC68_PATCE